MSTSIAARFLPFEGKLALTMRELWRSAVAKRLASSTSVGYGLEYLVEIGENFVVSADLKSPAHGDIDRAAEGFLKKFGDGCDLKESRLSFRIEFDRDIHIGLSNIVSACYGAKKREMPNAGVLKSWPHSLDRYGQRIARSVTAGQGGLAHFPIFAANRSGDLVEAPSAVSTDVFRLIHSERRSLPRWLSSRPLDP